MKKISIFMSALALLAFASCDKENNNDLGDDFIEDGFYVVGEATGSDEIQADYMMAAGFNEVTKTKRDGMYEKYVALEAGKTFSLAIYEAGDITYFGAELADMDITGRDNNPGIVIKRGALQEGENAPKMSVAESGLYHIVLDLNKAKDLNTALIIVIPTKWGVRGAMNGWGYTALNASEFNKKTMTFSLKDVVVKQSDGFKFAYADGWKVDMDDLGKVKAEIGLGNDATEDNLELMPNNLVQYGKNIKIERGIYDIELVWTLKGGNLSKSYTAKVTKTGTPERTNYAECVLELVGSGIAEQTGSTPDGAWSWGNCLLAANNGKPTFVDGIYTWTWSNVTLLNDGWKVRTQNNEDQTNGINKFDLGSGAVDKTQSVEIAEGGDIKVAAGTYNITLTCNEEDTMKLVIKAVN